jgi:Flp pilus assembly protein TadG
MKTRSGSRKSFFAGLRRQSGAAAILVAFLMIVFLGIAALALDVGYLYVVRTELQNAADAAALAGAGHLYPRSITGAVISVVPPEWGSAEAAANYPQAPANSAGGVTLTDYEVRTGYWNLATGTLSSALGTQGPQDAPAVQVTVRRSGGENSGPVNLFFARALGIGTADVSATATAVTACPGVAYPGALFPIAIRRSVADRASEFGSRSSTIRIGSDYHYPADDAGQWTSFDVDANDVPFIRNLIEHGNPNTVTNLDSIWIQPGTKNTIYNEVPLEIDVALPVVLDADFDTHARVPVYGFIGFHVTGSKKGNDPYVEGYFTSFLYIPQSGPVGPCYGAYTPPRLVQ